MSKQTEALKLALEALESLFSGKADQDRAKRCSDAITAIREALAKQPAQGCDYCNHPLYAGIKCRNCGREQPAQQQEPVAKDWRHVIPGRRYTDEWDSVRVADYNQGWNDCQKKTKTELEKLYTSPPASKPLTDEQWQQIAAITGCARIEKRGRDAILRVFQEAAHGIKEDA